MAAMAGRRVCALWINQSGCLWHSLPRESMAEVLMIDLRVSHFSVFCGAVALVGAAEILF